MAGQPSQCNKYTHWLEQLTQQWTLVCFILNVEPHGKAQVALVAISHAKSGRCSMYMHAVQRAAGGALRINKQEPLDARFQQPSSIPCM